ncbi:uncharacterized protein LOC108742582 isoform X2 [Agrilus planipennis]|nr:uncharacterized protein LOC108742582 isoform X2 [Agrilus planipennis]
MMIFTRLETNAPASPKLWDNKFIFMPIFYTAFTILAEPWVRKFITQSTWARLVATTGTCLICAGLLLSWKGINNAYNVATFIFAGIVTGIGSSLVITQSEVLVTQYFRLKLKTIRAIFQIATAIGFIVTPITLGHHIIKNGVLHVIIWYQAIILQGIVISLAFKKPQYLKSERKPYNIIRNASDDEDDVLATRKTELKEKNKMGNLSVNDSDSPEAKAELPRTSEVNQRNGNQTPSSTQKITARENWETFDDNAPNQSKIKVELHETFGSSSDIARKTNNNIVTNLPQSLFEDNNATNSTYSYESLDAVGHFEDLNTIYTISNVTPQGKWSIRFGDLKEPTFYKSLLQVITTKFSTFTFWILFPSYFYTEVEHLSIRNTTFMISCVIGVSILLFTIVSNFVSNNNIKHKALFWWIFSWAGAIGYFTISTSHAESALLFGAVNISLSLSLLNVLDNSLFKVNAMGQSSRTHCILCTVTGLAFCTFFLIDISYRNCFLLLALLQFLTGSIWLVNFIFKKIKEIRM